MLDEPPRPAIHEMVMYLAVAGFFICWNMAASAICGPTLAELRSAIAKPAPVERAGDLWIRRGDLFAPFSLPVNGDKVRQTLALLLELRREILRDCGNTVAFA